MAEIVNLRRVRKALQKTADAAAAGTNRAKHGRTRAERIAVETEAARLRRVLDGAALAGSAGDGEPRE